MTPRVGKLFTGLKVRENEEKMFKEHKHQFGLMTSFQRGTALTVAQQCRCPRCSEP